MSTEPAHRAAATSPTELRPWLKVALLLLAGCVAYLPATQCGFIWDDNDYVTENRTLRDWEGLRQIWLDPSATPQYYPLVHTTFWCEYQLWELNASGYHITNIVIHLINSLLLWRLLWKLQLPGAWFAALLFAIHPVHVESVAWITERKNVLSGMFYLLSMLAFLRFWNFVPASPTVDGAVGSDRTTSRYRWFWYLACFTLFVAALLSKTITATMPAVILVLLWWKQGDIRHRQALTLIPLFMLGITLGLMTAWLEKVQVGASGIDWELSFIERCLIAGRALWFYAGKLVWPHPLIFTYARWEIDSSQIWQFAFPVAVLVLVAVLWWNRARWGRGPLAAIFIFAGTLFPALGFLDVYPMRFSFVADHFQYLASIAILALLVAVLTQWYNVREQSRFLVQSFAVITVLVLVGLTWRQCLIYEGLEVLWRDTLAKNPDSFMAHNNLGALLNRRGDYAEAEIHLRESIRLKPDFPDSIINLGKAREGQGDFPGAMAQYQQAVQIQPNSAPALNGIGAMHGALGDIEAAEKFFRESANADRSYTSARINLATIYSSRGDFAAAIEELQQALEVNPELTTARQSLIQAYMGSGDFEQAERLLENQLVITPNDVPSLGMLGVVYANQRKFNQAIQSLQQVLALSPQEPNALYYLAEIHRQMGNEDEARRFQQQLERVAPPIQ